MDVLKAPHPFRILQLSTDDLAAAGAVLASGTLPKLSHLILLVFEAVLEVVCVSLPGYIAARHGFFDADAQKLVANLNVLLFTPCLGIRSPLVTIIVAPH